MLLPRTAAAQAPNSGTGSIVVTGSVQALRIGIVDQSGTIIQVWSNTGVPQMPAQWRLGSVRGQQVPVTDSIRAQYQAIESRIDWSRRGLVYQAPSPVPTPRPVGPDTNPNAANDGIPAGPPSGGPTTPDAPTTPPSTPAGPPAAAPPPAALLPTAPPAGLPAEEGPVPPAPLPAPPAPTPPTPESLGLPPADAPGSIVIGPGQVMTVPPGVQVTVLPGGAVELAIGGSATLLGGASATLANGATIAVDRDVPWIVVTQMGPNLIMVVSPAAVSVLGASCRPMDGGPNVLICTVAPGARVRVTLPQPPPMPSAAGPVALPAQSIRPGSQPAPVSGTSSASAQPRLVPAALPHAGTGGLAWELPPNLAPEWQQPTDEQSWRRPMIAVAALVLVLCVVLATRRTVRGRQS